MPRSRASPSPCTHSSASDDGFSGMTKAAPACGTGSGLSSATSSVSFIQLKRKRTLPE